MSLAYGPCLNMHVYLTSTSGERRVHLHFHSFTQAFPVFPRTFRSPQINSLSHKATLEAETGGRMKININLKKRKEMKREGREARLKINHKRGRKKPERTRKGDAKVLRTSCTRTLRQIPYTKWLRLPTYMCVCVLIRHLLL